MAIDGVQTENPIWGTTLAESIAFILDAGLPQTVVDKMTKNLLPVCCICKNKHHN